MKEQRMGHMTPAGYARSRNPKSIDRVVKIEGPNGTVRTIAIPLMRLPHYVRETTEKNHNSEKPAETKPSPSQ